MNRPGKAAAQASSRRILALAGDARTQYVVINLAVNLLFLARSYVFMLVLDYRELGLVTLAQSIVLLLGILQFGVLSGGYRLILSEEGEERQRIGDFVYSFIGALGVVAMSVAVIAMALIARPEDGMVGLLGTIGGTAMLIRSWQTNQMIAEGRLSLLNAINLGSSLASLLGFAFLGVSPIYACIAVVVAQPLLFAIGAWATGGAPAMRRLVFSATLGKRILGAGFILFLSGMLLQVNIQLERWYVTAELGIDALGHLFIAIMMVTLLQLVPVALDAIFLPSAVRAHGAGDVAGLRKTMRNYLLLLIAYAAVAALAIAFLAEPVIALLAPTYLPDLTYAYLIAPGALLLAMSSAFALTYTVLIRYRYLLIAYATGTVVLAAILLGALATDRALSLEAVMLSRSICLGLTALLTVAGWWIVSRDEPGMRLR